MTLGSLFDGSGGFPLAGALVGITPIWSSEIESYPLRVTAARFPNVKQLGSVLDINGAEIDTVDIITFGSPCQDLSVAGKQKGIHNGERSNLFFEAIRIIKEMRNADKANGRTGVYIRPRFAVWENVPGAFSSNKGEDFRAVLEAFASVCENDISIPRPKKWNTGGGMAGRGWSVAWRVYDAQYWGVPQRRKRIYLIADFASERAAEILFELESVCGNPAEGGETGERTSADAERGAGGSDSVRCLNPWDCQSKRQHDKRRISYAPSLYRADTAGCNDCGWRIGEMYTLNTIDRPVIAFAWSNSAKAGLSNAETAPTIKASRNGESAVCAMDCRNMSGDGIRYYTQQRIAEYVPGGGGK